MQYGIGSLPAEEENSKKGKQPHYIEEAMEQHENLLKDFLPLQ